jgi:transmembrane sensor
MKQTPDQNRLQDLAHRWLEGKISEVESKEFNSWFREGLEGPVEIPEMFAASEAMHKKKLWEAIEQKKRKQRKSRVFSISWKPMTAAAAILITLGTGIWLYNSDQGTQKQVQDKTAANDIAPGKMGATLTLANGKKIYISAASSGKLADAAGVTISKTADGQIIYSLKATEGTEVEYNILQTNNGEQVQVILPDQSKVFLNAATSLKYPSTFSKLKERRVELSGEAYFEVAKDKLHPFIVKSTGQEVTVLGTHFNVNAYPNEGIIKTTLLEGAVRINDDKVLIPGQLAINKQDMITIDQANISLETAWIENYFVFDGETTESVMRKVARWYNISVNYSTDELKSIPLSGRISRTKSLTTVLERISKAANFRFTIEGRTITVERN